MLWELTVQKNGSECEDSRDTRCSVSVDLESNEAENTERAVVTKAETASVSPEPLTGTGESLMNMIEPGVEGESEEGLPLKK